MAAGGFFPLSSPGSSSSSTVAEVEGLIAEAADLVALEQIAKLNSAHLADDAFLPADMESRFRRLKNFPAASEARASPASPKGQASDKGLGEPAPAPDAGLTPAAEPENTTLAESDLAFDTDAIFTATTATNISPVKLGGAENRQERRSENGLPLSPSISPATSSSSQGSSPSPPRGRACCFGFSPRKSDSRKKGDRDRGGMGFRKEDDHGLLSDLGTFSLREQRRSMRRAMREEEKVVQEAQKMVKWVKQASARMDVSEATIDELLSDLQDERKTK